MDNTDAIDQLIELMASEAGKEHIKHQLQAIIAAEVREAITIKAGVIIREVIGESTRAIQTALTSQDNSELIEQYAEAVVKKMGHFAKEPEQILEAVAVKLQAGLTHDAVYSRTNELIEEGKERLMERAFESIDRRVNEVLREQLNFWKERAEELTRTIQEYHMKLDRMAMDRR